MARVTNEKTKTMEEFTYLDIVDLDESCANRLVTESATGSKTLSKCPHHIVKKVVKIVGERIVLYRYEEEPKALQKPSEDLKSLSTQHEKIINMITELKEKIDNLEKMQTEKL